MQYGMACFLDIAALMLFLLGGSGLFLAFIAFADRCRAAMKKRSLFEKGAQQVDALCAIVLLLFAAASDADCFFSGAINGRMAQACDGAWLIFCLCASAVAFFAVLAVVAKKEWKRVLSALMCALSLPSLALLLLLSWSFFFAVEKAPAADGLVAALAQCGRAAASHAGFWLHSACMLAAMAASACVLAACWHVLCRSRNDYGRDFYTAVLGAKSRQAAGFLLALTICLAGAAAHCLCGEGMCERFWVAVQADTLKMIFCSLTLLVPAAFLLCLAVGRHALPMQRKSLVFIAVFCLYAGMIAFHRLAVALPLF